MWRTNDVWIMQEALLLLLVMPSESAFCLSSALLTALPVLIAKYLGGRLLLCYYVWAFFKNVFILCVRWDYLTEGMYCIQESLLCSFTDTTFLTALSSHVVFFFYSQDPAWSRPTFLFLHTYFVGLLSSMEWSITKVSVVKHSGTPVFKVSSLLTAWPSFWSNI